MITFPRDFLFGVATSAYQIEGAADIDGKGLSIWDTFSRSDGRVAGNIPGDRGAGHYDRLEEDLGLLAQMGVDSYRFSFSWSRVLPDGTGRVNTAGMDFYDRLIDGLLSRSIVPNATLYHWDLPQALEDRGGWLNPDVSEWFGEYAHLMGERFGDRIKLWSTLNEPISLWVGYGMGTFAPGIADPRSGKQAMHHAMVAHGRAVEALRATAPDASVGIVIDIWQRHAARDDPRDRALARRDEEDSFRFFLDAVLTGRYDDRIVDRLEREGTMPSLRAGDLDFASEPPDFLGINVYGRVVVNADHYRPEWWVADDAHPGGNFLDNGMEFYPQSVYDAVAMLKDDYGWRGPLYITENGTSDPNPHDRQRSLHDHDRIRYLEGFLTWTAKALERGADIRGYYAWSLMDNYEWAAAYTQRFGLIHVDFDSMVRTPKASADWYSSVINSRTLRPLTES